MRNKFRFSNKIKIFASKIVICGVLAIVFFSCAQIGTPSGGQFDRTPPKSKFSKPPHNSINFKGKKQS